MEHAPLTPAIEPPKPRPPVEVEAFDTHSRTEHTVRLLTLIGVIVLLVATLAFNLITTISLRTDLARSHKTGLENEQLLQLVEGAVGPAATKTSQAKQALLIQCLDNRIDVDTGRAAVLPQCKP